jgi:predicted amino acid dehydrogenase
MVSNLQKAFATFDRLAAWVKASILNTEGLGRRADMVDFWIKVTEVINPSRIKNYVGVLRGSFLEMPLLPELLLDECFDSGTI